MLSVSLARRAGWLGDAVASAGAMCAALGTFAFDWSLTLTRGLAASLLAASALLVHVRSTGAQLFTRGLWGSALVLASINAVFGWRGELAQSLLVMAGSAAALAAAGRRGLGAADASGFAPVGFRRSLVVALAMALADAHSLLFYGVASLERYGVVSSALLLGALQLSAIVGLYRLRVWGLLVALATSLAILGSAAAGVLSVPPMVGAVLIVTALVEIAVLMPLTRAVARGAARREAAVDGAVLTRVRIAGVDPGGDGVAAHALLPDQVRRHDPELAEEELSAEEEASAKGPRSVVASLPSRPTDLTE